ncbi:MAG: DUF1353 domain-containing protein [Thalassovita sp.]
MLRISILTSLVALLAACEPATVSTSSNAATRDYSCAAAQAQRCTFLNAPIQLQRNRPTRLPQRKATFFPMAATLKFVDGAASNWAAPKGTLTDGASIPSVFVPLIGNPTSARFASAAAMHDAYCGVGNEQGVNYHSRAWPEVHRMFYDALRVSGTPERKAKLMFAAVYLAGPRWDDWRRDPNDLGPERLRDILSRVGRDIETTNPTVTDLMAQMDRYVATEFSKNPTDVALVADGPYGDGQPGVTAGVTEPSPPSDPTTPPGGGVGDPAI